MISNLKISCSNIKIQQMLLFVISDWPLSQMLRSICSWDAVPLGLCHRRLLILKICRRRVIRSVMCSARGLFFIICCLGTRFSQGRNIIKFSTKTEPANLTSLYPNTNKLLHKLSICFVECFKKTPQNASQPKRPSLTLISSHQHHPTHPLAT